MSAGENCGEYGSLIDAMPDLPQFADFPPSYLDIGHLSYDSQPDSPQTQCGGQDLQTELPIDEGVLRDNVTAQSSDAEASSTSATSLESAFAIYPSDNSTITYLDGYGGKMSIKELSSAAIGMRCPLLAAAFEETYLGQTLHLDLLTVTSANPFVRYLYTGTYACDPYIEAGIYEDVPSSTLLHCEMYRLGLVYDLRDLQLQAYVNLVRQCEYGCSSPEKPLDLCEAIWFIYRHFTEQENPSPKSVVISYCVSQFLRHKLQVDDDFCALAYHLRPFYQDLVRECMERRFEDDTAAAIIRMPFEYQVPETYASREDVKTSNFCEFAQWCHEVSISYQRDLNHKRCASHVPTSQSGMSALPIRTKDDGRVNKSKRRVARLTLRQKETTTMTSDEEDPQSDSEVMQESSSPGQQCSSNVGVDQLVYTNDIWSSDEEFEMAQKPAQPIRIDASSDSEDSLVIVDVSSDSDNSVVVVQDGSDSGPVPASHLSRRPSNTITTHSAGTDVLHESDWDVL